MIPYIFVVLYLYITRVIYDSIYNIYSCIIFIYY